MSEQGTSLLTAPAEARDGPEDHQITDELTSLRPHPGGDISSVIPEIDRDAILEQAFRITGDLAGAEDVLQSLLVNVMRLPADRRTQIRSWESYIAVATRNLAVRWRKSHRPHNHQSFRADSDDRVTEDFTELVADENEINFMLSQIPAACREAFVYFVAEDCTAQEVAARLRINTGTVKKRLQRAALKLAAARAAYTRRNDEPA
jgi:RNA polymerase sigma-70 factor (ECF subfamily)